MENKLLYLLLKNIESLYVVIVFRLPYSSGRDPEGNVYSNSVHIEKDFSQEL